MSAFKSATFIINPRSSGGLSPSALRRIELKIKARFPEAKLRRTTGPRAAVEMAREARAQGVEALGVVGGDGTMSEVVNGLLMDGSEGMMPVVGLLPTGTGCDLAKSLDVPKDIDRALEILDEGRIFKSDVGRIQCQSVEDGSPLVYHFINIGGFGASGELVNRVNNSSKRLGGFVSFAMATITTTATYKGCNVRLRLDDGEYRDCHLNAVILANGQFQGGGMRTGKGARMNSGRFKVITIEQRGPAYLLSKVGYLYSGDLEKVDGIEVGEITQLEAHPIGQGDVLIEADGEQPGKLPASFEILGEILPLCIGPEAPALGG